MQLRWNMEVLVILPIHYIYTSHLISLEQYKEDDHPAFEPEPSYEDIHGSEDTNAQQYQDSDTHGEICSKLTI